MNTSIELNEKPRANKLYMFCGWRQWADAGSVSSGLPQYLIDQTQARRIGSIKTDGFYLFQIPGTHSLVRPTIEFKQGFPQSLHTPRNEIFYTDNEDVGILILLGDEPHLNIEQYVDAILSIAEDLNVSRLMSFAGVYGELPHNKERSISCIYSKRVMKDEIGTVAVNFSDYHGGASIGSYLCRRAFERDIEYMGLYAFVPTYELSNLSQIGNAIRIEEDYKAWLDILKRVNYLLKTNFDLNELKQLSDDLIKTVDEKLDEIDTLAPQLNIKEYVARIAEEFNEQSFDPLSDVWEDELRRLLDDADDT